MAPLTADMLMRADRIKSVMAAQDKLCGLSRRSLGRVTLGGTYDTTNDGFSIPSVIPTDPAVATQVYSDSTTWRTVGNHYAVLTPGCFPKASILYFPSGETQVDDGAAGFLPGGAAGDVRCVVTFSPTIGAFNFNVNLPASTLQYAGIPTAQGGVVEGLVRRESPLMAPYAMYTSELELRRYTRPPIAIHIQVQVRGGARVVDAHIFESPHSMAMEADDTADEWCSHFYDEGLTPFVSWPYQRFSETTPDGNPKLGAWHLMDVHHAQALRLGPHLFNWNAYDENTIDPTDNTDAGKPRWSTTSTSYVGIPDTAITSWDEDSPGWSLSTGGYARNFYNNCEEAMRSRVGVVPMLFILRADTGSATTPMLKVQAGPESSYEIALLDGFTVLRCNMPCGINPQQTSHLQAFAKVASGTLYMESMDGFFMRDGWPSFAAA